jgi:hypothetical protein
LAGRKGSTWNQFATLCSAYGNLGIFASYIIGAPPIEKIPQDAGRHCFATYRWQATDMATVLKETGHSERVFRSHHHGFVEKEWTEKFRNIMAK